MSQLPLYLSAPHACSYRPGQAARSAFLDPRLSFSRAQRQALAEAGFRRSGAAHYRPACQHCQACESVRVDVAAFQANRQQRRCWRDNQDLVGSWSPALDADERYQLYREYLSARHADGEMDPDDRRGFASFLCDGHRSGAEHLLLRESGGRLVAVGVVDRLPGAYSAVYTFFDPALATRSLGRYMVLRLITECREAGLPWLYLGYHIADCHKMSYKSEYRPQQRHIAGRWQTPGD